MTRGETLGGICSIRIQMTGSLEVFCELANIYTLYLTWGFHMRYLEPYLDLHPMSVVSGIWSRN